MAELPQFGSCIDPEKESQGKEPKISNTPEFKRIIYGNEPNSIEKEHTVLLVGVSKCGKSTLIEFIANFFMGVKSPHEKLPYVTRNITNEDVKDTKDFCLYKFCTKDSVFNFIDSPSINNESGFIVSERKEIFKKSLKVLKEKRIRINALGFVIQNHFVRLGPAEENILKFVTSLVEKDNIHHIVPFITYADANTPPVLDALKKFDIKGDNHLAFNNVCLNTSTTKITPLMEMFWEDGLDNIQKGIDYILDLESIELMDINIVEKPEETKIYQRQEKENEQEIDKTSENNDSEEILKVENEHGKETGEEDKKNGITKQLKKAKNATHFVKKGEYNLTSRGKDMDIKCLNYTDLNENEKEFKDSHADTSAEEVTYALDEDATEGYSKL